MNRRKAIYAMLCAIAGPSAKAQINIPGAVTTVGTFSLPLDNIDFEFAYKGKTVKLTGEEIWKELQP